MQPSSEPLSVHLHDELRGGRSVHNAEDGCSIRDEALKGGRVVSETGGATADSLRWWKLPKGCVLELAKSGAGSGILRVRSASKQRMLLSIQVCLVKRLDCPEAFEDKVPAARIEPGCGWLCGAGRRRGRIFEVEGCVERTRVHAAFLVDDPAAWVAAVGAKEWCEKRNGAGAENGAS